MAKLSIYLLLLAYLRHIRLLDGPVVLDLRTSEEGGGKGTRVGWMKEVRQAGRERLMRFTNALSSFRFHLPSQPDKGLGCRPQDPRGGS